MKVSEQGISNLAEALSKFQAEVSNPTNTEVNPQFRKKYAPLDVVINTAKPYLAKNGLSFIQSTGAENDSISVITLLIHESGEWIESDPLVLPAYQNKGGGVKEFNAQGAGSSLTYARRYSLSAILGLSSEDDDDANGQVFGGNAKDKVAASTTTQGNVTVSNTTSQSSAPTPTAREKAVQAAKDRAAANADKPSEEPVENTEVLEVSEGQADTGVEPINEGQLKAIGNMLKIISKKKGTGFIEADYVKGLLEKYSKPKLESLSFEEGKLVVVDINADMRK